MEKFPVSIKRRFDKSDIIITSLIVIILDAIMILALLFNTLYEEFYIVGTSMRDTLKGSSSLNEPGGDYVYICRYIQPKKGDIVVIDAGDTMLIKRVIAFGGESVAMQDGVLYVNDCLVEEPYVTPRRNVNPEKNTFSKRVVDEGCVFFMGDNRDSSEDSRGKYGCLPVEQILGVVTGWSLQMKDLVTGWNTFFDFILPGA